MSRMAFHGTVTAAGLFLLLAAPSPVFGSMVDTIPPGLNPGDHYRLIFVTSATISGTSGDISVYDNFVNSVANASSLATLGATWDAVVSTIAISAAAHIGVFTDPIYRVDGLEVASGSAGLWSGSLFDSGNPNQEGVFLDEQGNEAAPPQVVWSGTATNGSALNPLGGPNVEVGCATIQTSQWIDLGSFGSDAPPLAVYAISSELTVPLPEPASAVIPLMATLLLLLANWLSRAGWMSRTGLAPGRR